MIDTRELRLMVEGQDFGSVVKREIKDAKSVRKFALAIDLTAKNVINNTATPTEAVEPATRSLEARHQAIGPADAAPTDLSAAQTSTRPIGAAKAALDAA